MGNPTHCDNCGAALPPNPVECPACGVAVDTLNLEPTTRSDPLVGAMLGEYEIKQRVGAGGMGIVYEALHQLINKKVAIKVLRPDFANDPDQVARLVSEARAVNAIRHRSIVDIFGLGTLEDGRPYIVMEFLEGKSVEQMIERDGALPITDALGILEEVVAALGAAHSAGVIHRDVKPSNIFVVEQKDGTKYVKLLDFGLAKRANVPGSTPHEKPTQLVGTPDYMSPEQARGITSPRSDLYSLGVTAFHMMTARIPFAAKTVIEMIVAHMQWPVPRPSSMEQAIPPAVDDFILGLMEKDPARRPAAAEAVRSQLMRLRKQLTLSATRIVAAPLELSAVARQLPQALLTTAVRPAVKKVPTRQDFPVQGTGGKLNPVLPRTFTPGKPMPATAPPRAQEETLPRPVAAVRPGAQPLRAIPGDTQPGPPSTQLESGEFHGASTVLAPSPIGDPETQPPSGAPEQAPALYQTLDEEKPLGSVYGDTRPRPALKKRRVWPWVALAIAALVVMVGAIVARTVF